jgi:hypothetical protein
MALGHGKLPTLKKMEKLTFSSQRAVYDKFKAMGYPTDHDRVSRPHHGASPDDTEASGALICHQPYPLLASQRFENKGNNSYNTSLLLQGHVTDEHLPSCIALDTPRHPANEVVNDGTFGTPPGSGTHASGLHRSKELSPGLSKMGPSHQRKRRNTSNTPEQELVIQNLRKVGLLNDPQHSGGRTKPRRGKEAPIPATDFQTFLKLSSRVDSQGGQQGKDTATSASHTHPMRKIRSLFDIKSSASKARAKQNSPFADNDSGYQSGRRTPSTLYLRDSPTSPLESLTEFRGLYRVACHTLHEPKRPDQHRETQPCHLCGCSGIHILAWSANHMTLQEFEAELKSKDPDDVRALDAAGNSALHYAAISGASYTHLTALIDGGVPLYARNTANQNFLHCLQPCDADTKCRSIDCFKLGLIKLLELIEPRIAFSQQDNDGQTALHVLASYITEPELRDRTFK